LRLSEEKNVNKLVANIAALTLIPSCLAMIPVVAAADSADASKAEVMQKLHSIEAALARGDSAKQIATSLYAENVLLTGEGEPKAEHGLPGAIEGVQGWLESLGASTRKPSCKYELPEPYVSSSTTFTSFVVLRCKANPPVLAQDQELRMMYSWQKSSQGWHVVLEMWAPGKM
jgi:hypothetical protein